MTEICAGGDEEESFKNSKRERKEERNAEFKTHSVLEDRFRGWLKNL